MRVLVACEFSGVVREAFKAKGCDAWSCDLLPTEQPGQHIQQSVFVALEQQRWDLLVFHWPCTLLCNSGVRWLYGGKGTTPEPKRWNEMTDSAKTFAEILNCGVEKICGENPIPHRYAAALIGPYSQIIQPWQYGHGEIKATCLWLKNLPLLKPTNIVDGRTPRVHHASPGPDRWKQRSRTLKGIAEAMATQWTQ